jgi:hypothetical protein
MRPLHSFTRVHIKWTSLIFEGEKTSSCHYLYMHYFRFPLSSTLHNPQAVSPDLSLRNSFGRCTGSWMFAQCSRERNSLPPQFCVLFLQHPERDRNRKWMMVSRSLMPATLVADLPLGNRPFATSLEVSLKVTQCRTEHQALLIFRTSPSSLIVPSRSVVSQLSD